MTLDSSPPDAIAPSVDPRIERSRQAVLDASVALLFEFGPDEITHAKVAAAADVSRTTVYKHFPQRSDLLHATLDAIGKHVPPDPVITDSVGDNLVSMLNHLAVDLRDDGRTKMMAVMIERALHDETVSLVRDRFLTELTEAFTSILDAGARSGQLRDQIDPLRALASMAGSLLFHRLFANAEVSEDLVRSIVDDFVAAHRPTERST